MLWYIKIMSLFKEVTFTHQHPTSVRLTHADVQLLETVADHLDQKATASGLVRAAMRVGLAQICNNPSLLQGVRLDTRGAKPGVARGSKSGPSAQPAGPGAGAEGS